MDEEEKRRKHAEKMRKWRAANPERNKAYQRAYVAARPELRERKIELKRQWRIANPERARELEVRAYENRKRKLHQPGRATGERHPHWKGDGVGYSALHLWVVRHRGKPTVCEHCGNDEKQMQWANADHKYRRVLEDWIRLCPACHTRYDYSKGFRVSPGGRRKQPD